MKYLSGLDNLFLNQETETQHMHVGGLGLYNPSTAPGGFVRFKNVLDFFTERMAVAPVFRRCLTHSMLDSGRPFWVDDPDVDVEYHVRHMGLPEPGDWRQLMIQIARIHSRPMDLTKPLWEAYIIEGLDNIPWLPGGSFALYLKFHHSAVDGEAAAHLIGNLHTPTLKYAMDTDREKAALMTQKPPQAAEILSRSLLRKVEQMKGLKDLGISLGNYAVRIASPGALKRALSENKDVAELIKSSLAPKQKRPDTLFNKPVSAHRSLESVGFSIDDCNMIRKQLGRGTINDLFLTIVGGATHQYLSEQGESPDGNLMGTMPMTLRGDNKSGDQGNQIAQVYYDLHSQTEDPIARLDAISNEINDLKKGLDTGLGKDFQARLLELLPASIIAKPLTKSLGDNANVNISNVRGPNLSLYMAGARLERFIPFSLVTDGCGLNITAFSYNGVLAVAVTCCREMMPDPKRYCELMEAEFEALKQAAAALGKEPQTKKIEAKKRSIKGASIKKATISKVTKKTTKKKTPKKAPIKKDSAKFSTSKKKPAYKSPVKKKVTKKKTAGKKSNRQTK